MDYCYKITTHGRNIMAACLALEKPLKITRVAFGAGKVDEGTNLADVHQLLAYVTDGEIAERKHEDDRLYLTLQYANSQHPSMPTFLLSEFAVYCKNPETEAETDLLYGTLGDYRQPVPAYNPAYPPSVFNFPLTLILSDEINVSVAAPFGLVTHGELVSLVDGMAVRRLSFTIPASGWTSGGSGRYPYHRDIPAENMTERLIPALTILPEGTETAIACGLAPYVQTLEGAVRVFAAGVPSGDILAVLTVQGDASGYCAVDFGGSGTYSVPPATVSSLGAVKVGSGLTVDTDGTISVDTATEAEIEQALSGI